MIDNIYILYVVHTSTTHNLFPPPLLNCAFEGSLKAFCYHHCGIQKCWSQLISFPTSLRIPFPLPLLKSNTPAHMSLSLLWKRKVLVAIWEKAYTCGFGSQHLWTCLSSSFSSCIWLSLPRHKIASRKLVSLWIWMISPIFSASNSSVFPFYKRTVSVILRLLLAFVGWLNFCLLIRFTIDTLGFLFSPHI